jgi:hypothetical protein
MKKWIGPILAVLLVTVLVFLSGPFEILKSEIRDKDRGGKERFLRAQGSEEERKEQVEPYMLQVLKKVQEKLDAWLKSLNDRIENEDVTRLEVRFLEILRSILEWVKEKVDAKVESGEKGKERKKERGLFRETHSRYCPLLLNG